MTLQRTEPIGIRSEERSGLSANAYRLEIFLLPLFAFALVHAAYVLLLGIDKPILDHHYFRQTQTALSAYWMWRGGPWLNYETPVLGYPWSIPFEFPIFESIVALFRGIGIPIEIAGRLVSFGFYLGCLWPLRLLTQEVGLRRSGFLIIAVLFLSSPLYLYWSRTFMIESCALFFNLLWLALLLALIMKPRVLTFSATVIVGACGALAKSTTFAGFGIVAWIIVLACAISAWRNRQLTAQAAKLTLPILGCIIPLAAGIAWVSYSDHVKEANEFGAMLTSSKLTVGTWRLRASMTFWYEMLWHRVPLDILGYVFPVALIAGSCAFFKRNLAALALLCVAAFMSSLLIFCNLHFWHNYYQYAIGIFALTATALGIVALIEMRRHIIASAALLALVGGQLAYFHHHYAPALRADYAGNRILKLSVLVREKTDPNQGILVIGEDWNSAIPFYSERRALAVPAWTPAQLLTRVLADPQSFLGSAPLGATIYCQEGAQKYRATPNSLADFAASRAVVGEVEGCKLLQGRSSPR